MRKRAQRRSRPMYEEPKHIVQQMKPKFETKTFSLKKNWWIAVSIIGIFFLVLFLNTYFNLTSEVSIDSEGEGLEKFYLSGPDPYYNMRLVEETYSSGSYPYYGTPDPLLRYPIGARGGRAPLFNMMALGFSRLLAPFMDEVDAIGYSMQFVPALFGALLIFPVYFIGKELFNKKAAIIAAMFIAIIPIHLGSGHGSAYALFDHDSFNLLLFFLTFLFLIKSLKEKDSTKSVLYAILGGVTLAALTMTWVESQYLYVVIALYAIVQMFIDLFTDKIELRIFRTSSVILFSGYLISLPVIASITGPRLTIQLFLCIAITAFGVVYYIFGKKKIPWTISLPAIFSVGLFSLVFLYFIDPLTKILPFLSPLRSLSEVIYGSGIYGSKVSMTIAEANTYQISHTVMSFGPAIYWVGWLGFLYLCFLYYKNKQRKEYLFMIILFIVNIWLAGTAGRFLNDMVPLIAILGGWIIWLFVDWVDYKQMIRNIRSAGGGLHGIRRGIKFLHVFGILFVTILIVLPNAFVAFDAAIPNVNKEQPDGTYISYKKYMFGEDYSGAYGLGVGKERYWVDAFTWLSNQDTEIEDPVQRPAFISWWDYGFYEVAVGDHPTVADNFQDGIPTAANFHTAAGEKEAVVVLSTRLLEGNKYFNGNKLSEDVENVLKRHIGENKTEMIKGWLGDSATSPSYGEPIGAEYDEETSKEYTVGQQYPENAYYHDIVELLTNEETGLTDEEITWLYHDLQEATGFSIRYYGVEGYDRQIFNIFGFLSDKSLLLVNGIADDFVELVYKGYNVDSPGTMMTWYAEEILNMDAAERQKIVITSNEKIYKPLYFETMFYRTYIGPSDVDSNGNLKEFDYQLPCVDMRHFYTEYLSDLSKFSYYTNKGAVVIAKYYEGAYVNGSVLFNGEPADVEAVIQKNVTYFPGYSIQIDHDKNETVNGNFYLIAGADAYLTIRRYPNLGANAFVLKNIYFGNSTDPNLSKITEDDAMRRNGSNYERFLGDISIDPANVEGYAYIDKDENGKYNASVDEPMTGVTVTVSEILDPAAGGTPIPRESVEVDETGHYSVSGLFPGYYRIEAVNEDGFWIHLKDFVSLYPGNNSYNIAEPKDASIEGVIYLDANNNEEYDLGEKMNQEVSVDLLYKGEIIDSIPSVTNGEYSFDSLVPGKFIYDEQGREFNVYNISVTDSKNIYHTEVTVAPDENQTTTLDILLELATVTVSGSTNYNGKAIGNIPINFEIDTSEENNTAHAGSITSNDDGSYEIELKPGKYDVTVQKSEGETLVYSFDGKLSLSMGQDSRPYDISMEKISSTVTGVTSYAGANVENIEISFDKDESVDNNTAVSASTISDSTGSYSIELSTGSYKVSVKQEIEEDGESFNYTFSGKLVIPSDNAAIPPYEITMAKDE